MTNSRDVNRRLKKIRDEEFLQPPAPNFFVKRKWVLGAAALLTLTVLAYLPASRGGFIWDDDDYVTKNPLIIAPDGLQRIWFSLDSPSQYFPLTYSVFRLEHWFWGFNPAGYHWVNIILQSINALLLWRLLKHLEIPGSWLAAAIFAIHPVQVESVAWITELKNVLSIFFYLITIFAWWIFIEENRNRRWRIYALALGCFALALFAKTTVSMLPIVLLLILWLKEKPIDRSRLLEIVPFFLLSVGMGLLTMWWERFHVGTQGQEFSISLLTRVLIASRALWFYLGKLLWPTQLTFSYPRWTIRPEDVQAYGWVALTIAAAFLLYYLRRYFAKSIPVAMLFFAVSLAPLLGFIMLYTFRYTFVADHYQYIACIGPISLASAGVARLFQNSKPAGQALLCIGCGMLLLLLGGLTWKQCKMYANEETLWRQTLVRNPNSWMAYNILSNIALDRHDRAEAIADSYRGIALNPSNDAAYKSLGLALLETGKIDEAIASFQKAIELRPTYPDGYDNLGRALMLKGQTNEALLCFNKTIQFEPDRPEGYVGVAAVLLQTGQPDKAIDYCIKALALNPDVAMAHYNIGCALEQKGESDTAISEYQKAITIQPDLALAHNNLATAWLDKGRISDAIAQYRQSITADPDFADAHFNLGLALLRTGQKLEGLAECQKALQLDPTNAMLHNNFGQVLLMLGDRNRAILEFQTALRLKPTDDDVQHRLRNLGVEISP